MEDALVPCRDEDRAGRFDDIFRIVNVVDDQEGIFSIENSLEERVNRFLFIGKDKRIFKEYAGSLDFPASSFHVLAFNDAQKTPPGYSFRYFWAYIRASSVFPIPPAPQSGNRTAPCVRMMLWESFEIGDPAYECLRPVFRP